MMPLIAVLTMLLTSLSATAGMGRDLWGMANKEQKVELVKAYRNWFKHVAENDDLPQDEWDEPSFSWLMNKILAPAWAREDNLLYSSGGLGGLGGSCGLGSYRCPSVFAGNLCVPSLMGRARYATMFNKCISEAAPPKDYVEDIQLVPEQEEIIVRGFDAVDEQCDDNLAPYLLACNRLKLENMRTTFQIADTNTSEVIAAAGVPPVVDCAPSETPVSAPKAIAEVADEDEVVAEEPATPSPLTPQALMAQAMGEPLQFVGREKLDGSFREKSCVYQNSKVIVVYDYCQDGGGNKGLAMGMKILSRTGGMVEFYAEHTEPVSRAPAGQYEHSWRTSFVPTPALDGAQTVKKVDAAIKSQKNFPNGYCNVGGSTFAKVANPGVKFNQCVTGSIPRKDWTEMTQSWMPAAEQFHAAPGEQWTQLLSTVSRLPRKSR